METSFAIASIELITNTYKKILTIQALIRCAKENTPNVQKRMDLIDPREKAA